MNDIFFSIYKVIEIAIMTKVEWKCELLCVLCGCSSWFYLIPSIFIVICLFSATTSPLGEPGELAVGAVLGEAARAAQFCPATERAELGSACRILSNTHNQLGQLRAKQVQGQPHSFYLCN